MENESNQPSITAPVAPGAERASAEEGPERVMFDKPNLQLRDPDPYAFANRIRKLLLLASVLLCVAAAPFLTRVFAYHARLGQMQAEYETAREFLGETGPELKAFEEASRSIAKKVGPSVVSVNKLRLTDRGYVSEGVGSGFIVDSEGYVITNEHVVRGSRELRVSFANGETSEAVVVGADQRTDLAVLKIDGKDLPALEWADSDRLQMGDLVWAVGSPFGLDNSISFGIVSATARRRDSGVTNDIYQEFFQSDVAVNPGNSGGPMVNLAGQVVGVNTMIIGRSFRGVSFSIPSELARNQYEALRKNGYVERGFLGVEPVALDLAFRNSMRLKPNEGVRIVNMSPDSPALRAGMRNDDVILRWNDHKAHDPTVLSQKIAATEVGTNANVLVRRLEGGKPIDKELTVRVGRRPNR